MKQKLLKERFSVISDKTKTKSLTKCVKMSKEVENLKNGLMNGDSTTVIQYHKQQKQSSKLGNSVSDRDTKSIVGGRLQFYKGKNIRACMLDILTSTKLRWTPRFFFFRLYRPFIVVAWIISQEENLHSFKKKIVFPLCVWCFRSISLSPPFFIRLRLWHSPFHSPDVGYIIKMMNDV